jgi:hypothetical protein
MLLVCALIGGNKILEIFSQKSALNAEFFRIQKNPNFNNQKTPILRHFENFGQNNRKCKNAN